VRVRTRDPIAGRRAFRGTLAEVLTEGIRVEDPDAGNVSIAFSAIERAHIDFDFGRRAKPHAHA
jgi:ribosome maturation factor RimP